MKTIATHERRTFLKSHAPVLQRQLISSTGAEQFLNAGTVLGVKDGKLGQFATGADADSILAEDVTVPAAGDAYALTYVHAEVIASELTWADGVSAADQKAAHVALRAKGVYASEA